MGEVEREHIVIYSPEGTVLGRLFAETGEVFVFLPPEAAGEIVFENVWTTPLPPLPLEHGEVAELDGAVCFKFKLENPAAMEEALLYQGRVASLAKLTGQ